MHTEHGSKSSCTTLLRIAITRIPSHSLPSELESCAGGENKQKTVSGPKTNKNSPSHEFLAENLELGRTKGLGLQVSELAFSGDPLHKDSLVWANF